MPVRMAVKLEARQAEASIQASPWRRQAGFRSAMLANHDGARPLAHVPSTSKVFEKAADGGGASSPRAWLAPQSRRRLSGLGIWLYRPMPKLPTVASKGVSA